MRLRRRVGLRHHLRVLSGAILMTALATDARAATDRYLASVPPDVRARSDAYFEGGYWITLWGTLLMVGIMWLLLQSGLSRRMRDTAGRITRVRSLQVACYWILFFAVVTAAMLPWTAYTEFFREHQYRMSTQTFGAWAGDQAKSFALGLVMGSLALMGLYAVLRRFTRTWWIWGAAFFSALLALSVVISPVFIAPIFNTYTPVQEPVVRERILRLARANGIEASEVWQSDASRQTTRISASVSGMLGTERITLNDNLLERCSPECVEAVMAHEIGHYVLNHVYELLLQIALVIVLGFAVLRATFERLRRRHESRWGVTGIADPAGLPVLYLVLTVYLFLMLPVINTIIRTNEQEADVFAVNAARQPDGFAEAALKLGESRKLDPSVWEERLFFDHPSGRTRILTVMTWKQEQAPDRSPGSASASAPPRPR